MITTKAIESNPTAYSVDARRCAAETLRGMAHHLWSVAKADPANLGKAFAADRMSERAEIAERAI